MSSFISYQQICHNCLTTDGARGNIMFNGDVSKFKKQTEYEFSKVLEGWFKEMEVKCRFCASPLVEGTEIQIGDYDLYDFDRLVSQCKETGGEFFLWKAIKKGQNIELQIGGKSRHDSLFIRECFNKLWDIIDSYPKNMLISNNQFGDLLICLTGDYDLETESFNPVVQRFYCSGMSYQEATDCINTQLMEFEMYDLVK